MSINKAIYNRGPKLLTHITEKGEGKAKKPPYSSEKIIPNEPQIMNRRKKKKKKKTGAFLQKLSVSQCLCHLLPWPGHLTQNVLYWAEFKGTG